MYPTGPAQSTSVSHNVELGQALHADDDRSNPKVSVRCLSRYHWRNKAPNSYLITRTAEGASSTSRSVLLLMSRVAHGANHEQSNFTGEVPMLLTAFIVSLVTLLSPPAQAKGCIRWS